MPEPPDARHILANERTLLAWLRTALTLMAGGFAASVLLTPGAPRLVRMVLGAPLIILGATCAIGGYRRWRAADAVLHAGGQDIPPTALPLVLTAGIVVLGGTAMLLLVWLL